MHQAVLALSDMVAALLLVLLCCYPVSVLGAKETPYAAYTGAIAIDDPYKCLIAKRTCNETRDCKSFVYSSDCLASRIPTIWALRAAQIESTEFKYHNSIACCFRCCLEYMTHLYDIKNTQYIMNTTRRDIPVYNDFFHVGRELEEYENIISNNTTSIQFGGIQPKRKKLVHMQPRSSSPVMSTSAVVRMSRQVYDGQAVHGVGGVSKVSVILSPAKGSWAAIKGRRSVLISPSTQCVSRDLMFSALRRVADFSNLGVVMLYSQQLPCNFGKPESKVPNKGSPRLETSLTYINNRFQLIPEGIRDSVMFERSLRRSHADPSANHGLTIDCTCAAQFQEGRALIEYLYGLNSRGEQHFTCHVRGKPLPPDGRLPFSRSSALAEKSFDIQMAIDGSIKIVKDNFKGKEEELQEYYYNLIHYKYALSPSTAHFLTPCEWEAVAMGVVPVMKYPLDVYSFADTIHETPKEKAWEVFGRTLENLYRELPMYAVSKWALQTVSEQVLNSKYAELTSAFAQEQHSISKVYVYSWINSIKKHLLTAKPSGRFFTKDHIEGSNVRAPIQCSRKTAPNDAVNGTIYSPGSNDTSSHLIELVIPRCCEDGSEFDWLKDLVSSMDTRIAVSLYYKCPHCLPKSKAKDWISNIIVKDELLAKRVKRGYHLLEDSMFVQSTNGRVISQSHAFDSVYNGKEVTAYLKHIITRYDSLAGQTVFLHSLPNAHISFEMFYRIIKYNLHCNDAVPFVHLNVKYKGGVWGKCCGFNSTCQLSTWQYIFQDKSPFKDQLEESKALHKFDVSTYSSAQFAVSRSKLRSQSLNFYDRMMMAINGSHDLYGCDNGTREGPWGGHRLTGQYERMWHVIYGHKPDQRQQKRSENQIL